MRKASITPFCSLCLMLIASVLFVLLESARVYGLDYYASLKAEALMDSLCAEYQPLLWEQYGILTLDGAYGTEYFSEDYMTERILGMASMQSTNSKETFWYTQLDLFQLSMTDVELEGYALATDEQGELFLKYLAERMKEEIPVGIAADIYERYQIRNTVQSSDLENVVSQATETLQWAKSSKWNEIQKKVADAETEEEEEQARSEIWIFQSSWIKSLENIFETVSEIKARGVLSMVLGDAVQLSDKGSKPKMPIAERKKSEGTIHYTGEADWYQKVLVLEYMDKYFSCYGEERNGHYLDYEIEYVLAGKDVEWKNLESVLQKLLFVRETANVTYLLSNAGKMQQAEEVARAVALLIGQNPAVVKIVQMGIIAAWAYAESILDVRALVSGEVIPIMKKDEEWTLDIANLLSVFQGNTKAKKCENGMGYKEYLKLLLITEREETMAYRMLEVMEQSLQNIPDYENCKMDQMYLAIQYRFHFESNPLFFSLVTIGSPNESGFHFWKEELRSYVP